MGRIGGMGPVLVGSAQRIADELQEWVDETDVDGFNLAYAITPGSFEDIVELVVPELRRRGVYPSEYVDGTLRHKLFGRGDRLRGRSPRANASATPARAPSPTPEPTPWCRGRCPSRPAGSR